MEPEATGYPMNFPTLVDCFVNQRGASVVQKQIGTERFFVCALLCAVVALAALKQN